MYIYKGSTSNPSRYHLFSNQNWVHSECIFALVAVTWAKNSATRRLVQFSCSGHILAGCPMSAQCRINESAFILSMLIKSANKKQTQTYLHSFAEDIVYESNKFTCSYSRSYVYSVDTFIHVFRTENENPENFKSRHFNYRSTCTCQVMVKYGELATITRNALSHVHVRVHVHMSVYFLRTKTIQKLASRKFLKSETQKHKWAKNRNRKKIAANDRERHSISGRLMLVRTKC